jgi:UDP-N-acetylmuramoylalanine--D-glutamate ligase
MTPVTVFQDKTVALFGLGGSGLATAQALKAGGAAVRAWDDNADSLARAREAGIETQDLRAADWSDFAALILSPGVPLTHPEPHWSVRLAREAGVEIIGDIELFARARPELPTHKVVGITGTNGKSTTTALVHHILKIAGVPTTMGGNIGLPILAQDPLPGGGVYVLELSSYQIDLTQSLDCDVAVLLNITPDHLDRYESFEAYAASKFRLLDMQSDVHPAVLGVSMPYADYQRVAESRTAKVYAMHPLQSLQDPYDLWNPFDTSQHYSVQSDWPTLQGPHNAENAGAAILVASILGISDEKLDEALRTYPGLPHRMERIRDKDGVLFVNDSKATNPTATAPALAAFERIRWICGGQAKTDDLDECAPQFGHVRKAYTIGEAGELFASLLSPHMDVAQCQTLERAVGEAAAEAASGDTVLLSPACASFDQFRDFEDRGDQFRKLVERL